MGLGILYWFIAMPQYESHSEMLIEDSSLSSSGGGSKSPGILSLMNSFSIGGFGSNSTGNEIVLLNTRQLFMNTVKALSLNRTYIEFDGLSKHQIYKDTPIVIESLDESYDKIKGVLIFEVRIKGDKSDVTIKKGRFNTVKELTDVTLPTSVRLPEGTFRILRTPHFTGKETNIRVIVTNYNNAITGLQNKLKITRPSKLTDGIEFKITSGNKAYGEAVLNSFMGAYNDIRINRRRSNAEEELKFLDERLAALFTDLNTLETDIASFKEQHNLLGIEDEAAVLVENATKIKTDMVESQAKVMYYDQLLHALNQPGSQNNFLPVFTDEAYPMIKDYNELIQTKKELERSAKSGHANLEMINNQIAEMRTSVIENINNLRSAAQIKASAESGVIGDAKSRLSSLPGYEKEYISLRRDQKLKNELYIFLLEKRESAVLQLYSTATLGFIIDEAYSDIKPTHKKQFLVLGICFVLTLLVPTIFVIVMMRTRRNKIYEPIDLTFIGIENNSVGIPPESGLHTLRNRLIADRRRILYVAQCGDADMGNTILQLASAYRSIGLDADIVASPASNDGLLHCDFIKNIYGSGADVSITEIPEPEDIKDIINAVSKDDAALVMVISEGKVKRTALRCLLKGFPEGNVYAIICK